MKANRPFIVAVALLATFGAWLVTASWIVGVTGGLVVTLLYDLAVKLRAGFISGKRERSQID
jgi:hypothetical protein